MLATVQKGKSVFPDDKQDNDEANYSSQNMVKDSIARLENSIDSKQQETAKLRKFISDLKVLTANPRPASCLWVRKQGMMTWTPTI
jgi:hypothetical protein